MEMEEYIVNSNKEKIMSQVKGFDSPQTIPYFYCLYISNKGTKTIYEAKELLLNNVAWTIIYPHEKEHI
jgi:hypothetical protein